MAGAVDRGGWLPPDGGAAVVAAMIPTFGAAMTAARRVQAAVEKKEFPEAKDSIVMSLYQLSAELRRLPERERRETARWVARRVLANTKESLHGQE